jgi:hypothetical protein
LDEDSYTVEESDESTNNVGLQVMPSVIYKQSQVAVKYLRKLMGKKAFDNPKDHEVIERLMRYITKPGDIILDSFAGSGTTGHAVIELNKKESGNRRLILVELESEIARNTTAERLRRVIQGYAWKDQKGNEQFEEGLGGGFQFCELGPSLFDANGQIRESVGFSEIAHHVFFTETGEPLSDNVDGTGPFLGVSKGVGVFLLYNGVLKDKSANGGNVLTRAVLNSLPPHDGPKVIYGAGCLLSASTLQRLGIAFRQIPYEIKVS